MKITIGKAVVECSPSELPFVLKAAGLEPEKAPERAPVASAKKKPKVEKKAEKDVEFRRSEHGVGARMMEIIREGKVTLPINGSNISKLGKLVYGAHVDEGYRNRLTRALIWARVTAGELRQVSVGTFDLEKPKVEVRVVPPGVSGKVVPPKGKRNLDGVSERMMRAILENEVALPISGENIGKLARIIYGEETVEAKANTWSALNYGVKKGDLKRLRMGEYDLA